MEQQEHILYLYSHADSPLRHILIYSSLIISILNTHFTHTHAYIHCSHHYDPHSYHPYPQYNSKIFYAAFIFCFFQLLLVFEYLVHFQTSLLPHLDIICKKSVSVFFVVLFTFVFFVNSLCLSPDVSLSVSQKPCQTRIRLPGTCFFISRPPTSSI